MIFLSLAPWWKTPLIYLYKFFCLFLKSHWLNGLLVWFQLRHSFINLLQHFSNLIKIVWLRLAKNSHITIVFDSKIRLLTLRHINIHLQSILCIFIIGSLQGLQKICPLSDPFAYLIPIFLNALKNLLILMNGIT